MHVRLFAQLSIVFTFYAIILEWFHKLTVYDQSFVNYQLLSSAIVCVAYMQLSRPLNFWLHVNGMLTLR